VSGPDSTDQAFVVGGRVTAETGAVAGDVVAAASVEAFVEGPVEARVVAGVCAGQDDGQPMRVATTTAARVLTMITLGKPLPGTCRLRFVSLVLFNTMGRR
jgi:hypothetical protein